MSEHNIAVDSGASVRLKTAGKYCDRDIVVTATAGGGGDIDALIDGSITEISSQATTVWQYAFYNYAELTKAEFPSATKIGQRAFQSCKNLTDVAFPSVTSIGNYAFYACSKLADVVFPSVTTVGSNALQSCAGLTRADLPNATSIATKAFQYCEKLNALILRASTLVSLGSSDAINSTPIASGTGYIYVPAALIDSYKAASGWSTCATQFRALEDYTVDGTITGALDESKI